MDYAKVISEIGRFLSGRGVRFGLAGAHALRAYGHARATNDLDLVVEEDGRAALLEFLALLGYEQLYVSDGFSNHVHPDSAWGRVDLIYLDDRTARALFGAARSLELAGIKLLVPSAEHLIAMKLAAIKDSPPRAAKDFPDILYLVQLPGVDATKVRGYFERYGLEDRFEQFKKLLERR